MFFSELVLTMLLYFKENLEQGTAYSFCCI